MIRVLSREAERSMLGLSFQCERMIFDREFEASDSLLLHRRGQAGDPAILKDICQFRDPIILMSSSRVCVADASRISRAFARIASIW